MHHSVLQYRSAFMVRLRIERKASAQPLGHSGSSVGRTGYHTVLTQAVPLGCGRTGCPDYLSLSDSKEIFTAYSKFHHEMLNNMRPMRLLVCVRRHRRIRAVPQGLCSCLHLTCSIAVAMLGYGGFAQITSPLGGVAAISSIRILVLGGGTTFKTLFCTFYGRCSLTAHL
jgi:hypothetical protein